MQDVPQKTDDTRSLARDRYEPADLGELMDFAGRIVQSRLCPKHFSEPEDVVLVVQQGAELGLTAMTSLQNSHVIHGQVGWDADLLKALCLQSGMVERWDYQEMSGERCAAIVQRTGQEPTEYEWTLEKARHIGLLDNSVWRQYPDTMLRHRLDADAARAEFPDVVRGMRSATEIEDRHRSDEAVSVEVVDSDSGGNDTPDPNEAFEPDEAADDLEAAQKASEELDGGDDLEAHDSRESLASLHRSLGQIIGAADAPDDVRGAYRDVLQSSDVWSDQNACAEERDDLRDSRDQETHMREFVEFYGDGELDTDEGEPSDDGDDGQQPDEDTDPEPDADPAEPTDQERVQWMRQQDGRIGKVVDWLQSAQDIGSLTAEEEVKVADYIAERLGADSIPKIDQHDVDRYIDAHDPTEVIQSALDPTGELV